MTCRLVHGVRVAVEGALRPDPTDSLLGRFPLAPDGARDLTVRLRPSTAPVSEEGPLVMDLCGVRARLRDGALGFTDGSSTLEVDPGGALLDCGIHRRSLDDLARLEGVLLLLGLAAALRPHGLFHLHAAALRAPSGRGLLVVGDSGAGKTTLALALVRRGFGWLGDDTCLLAARTDGPAVLAFPRPFHVAERTAAAFPELVPGLDPAVSWRGKRSFEPRGPFGLQEVAELRPPLTLLLPEIADAPETTVTPASPVEALGALVEASALLFVRGMAAVDRQVVLLRELIASASCAHARLGRDLLARPEDTADRIATALDGAGPTMGEFAFRAMGLAGYTRSPREGRVDEAHDLSLLGDGRTARAARLHRPGGDGRSAARRRRPRDLRR